MRPPDLCFPWMIRGRLSPFPPDRYRFPSTSTPCDSFLALDSSQGSLDLSKKLQIPGLVQASGTTRVRILLRHSRRNPMS